MRAATSTKLTYDDYRLIPNDGRRHEIIDGAHVVNPAPNTKHQRAVLNIAAAFHVFLRKRRLGHVYIAPFDVVLSAHDVVQPDVIFLSNERLLLLNDANLRGAPNLAVEVLSPRTARLDRSLKLKRYDLFGVDEYWIVDTRREAVEIYRRTAAGLSLVDKNADPLATPLLPGFALTRVEVFEE